MRTSLWALPAVLVAACSSPSREASLTPTTPTTPTTPADPGAVSGEPAPGAPRGIEAADINRSADPCTDFFEYASGAWRAQNPIPEGKQKWSRRGAAREANPQKVAALIQEISAKADWPAGSPEQQVSDQYASCMDEAAADKAGISPLAPLLTELDGIKSLADVQRGIRRLHDLGLAVPFGATGSFNNTDPTYFQLNLVAGGLGLPERDAYLAKAPEAVAARAKYAQHVARVLVLGGMKDKAAAAAAGGIVALETRLAQAQLDADTASDPAQTDHKTTFAQLKQLVPSAGWDAYFDEAKLPREPLNVADPRFFQQVEKELKTTPVAVWKSYLRYHLLDHASPWLARPFADEAVAFKELGARPERCAELTETLLGEQVGKIYADRYFPAKAHAKAHEIARNLVAVLKDDVSGLAWMAPATRKTAIEKLDGMSLNLGYPHQWKDASALTLRRDALWANIVAARKVQLDELRGSLAKPTNRAAWGLPPSSAGAYIEPQLNQYVVPAGFLQAPYFDGAASDAVNYGAFGAGLAHDMTHTFDPSGSALDPQGRANKWWTEADQREFDKRAQCIIEQYDGYAIEPGVSHQGKLVLSEALGDQAGLHFAFLAFKKATAGKPQPTLDGFTPEQQFFLAWAQFRGEAVRIEAQREIVKGDSHPTPKFRVIGPLSNLPEFAEAFGCKAGAPMVRPAEKRCAVW